MFKIFKKQYRHFKKKYKDVDHAIWDLEFKKYKTLEIREEVRVEFDNKKAEIQNIQEQIKREKDKKHDDKTRMPEGDIARLEDDIVRKTKDMQILQGRIQGLDIEVVGCAPTNEIPEGHLGLNDQLKAHHELKQMCKHYMTKVVK